MARRRFPSEERGSTTIEFVVLFLGFFAVLMFVVEVTLYQFYSATLEKAAHAGVRSAVVSTPLHNGVPDQIARRSGGLFGFKCTHPSAPCLSFGTLTCTGATCESAPFNRMLAHMQSFNGQIQANHVTITYQDVGMGFAGGPVAPMVTVSVANVPYQTGVVGLLLQDTGVLASLPRRTASMTGEDLAQ